MTIYCEYKDCKWRKDGECQRKYVKMGSVGVCRSFESVSMCSCYTTFAERDGSLGGRCWGTKNVERCICGGDVNKCDFYKR